ncbi:hypothetical protein A2U01_0086895, partial [Trifolium medium]|nr:hypothetical protein [Trifolium medium]
MECCYPVPRRQRPNGDREEEGQPGEAV